MNHKSIIKSITKIQLKKSDNLTNSDYTDDFFKLFQEENKDLFIKFIGNKIEYAIPEILETLKKIEAFTININSFKYIVNLEKNAVFLEINNIKHEIRVDNCMYDFVFKITNILCLNVNFDYLNTIKKYHSKLNHLNSKDEKKVTGIEDSILEFIDNQIEKNNKIKNKLKILNVLMTKILELCIIINNANDISFHFFNEDLFTINPDILDRFYLVSDINIKELLLNIKNDINLINNLEAYSNEEK